METKDAKTGEVFLIDTEAYKRINIEETMPCPLEFKIENLTDNDMCINPFLDDYNFEGIKITKYRNKENKTTLKNIKEIKFQSEDLDKFWYKTMTYFHVMHQYDQPFCTLIDPYQSITTVVIKKFQNTISPSHIVIPIPARCSITMSAFEGDESQNKTDVISSKSASVLITNKTSEKIEVDAFKQIDNENVSIKYICGKPHEDFSIGLTGVYCQSNSSQVLQSLKLHHENKTLVLSIYICPYQQMSNVIMSKNKYEKTEKHKLMVTVLPHTTMLLNFWQVDNTETDI